MFGFKKKQKDFRPEYDKKLVKQLQKEHLALFKKVHKIEIALFKKNVTKTKLELQQLKNATLEHFVQEDIKLYWYLKTLYKDDAQTLEKIQIFEESIKDIQVTVIKFFEHYTKKDTALDDTFKEDFNGVVKALVNRIETEEKNLYPLYKAIVA